MSSTCSTIKGNSYGYRNDALYENIDKPFLSVLTYEMEELGNTDIVEYIFNNYLQHESVWRFSIREMCDKVVSYKQDFHAAFFEGMTQKERVMVYRLLNEYMCRKLGHKGGVNLFCKWLTTKKGYKMTYGDTGEAYTLTKYGFNKQVSAVVSDLGAEGVLVVSLRPFYKIESKKFACA